MDLFKVGFISLRLEDVFDIVIVALLFYKLYESLRESRAIRIFGVIALLFVAWRVVDLLGLRMLTAVLDTFLSLGSLAVVVIFAPEIRQFLAGLSQKSLLSRLFSSSSSPLGAESTAQEILEAVKTLRASGYGALIVLSGKAPLEEITETGDRLDSLVSSRLIYTIFQKESPLHDGAMIITGDRISAVRCILPLSKTMGLSPELGLRHRSAMGIAEASDVLVIVISEERREISLVENKQLRRNMGVSDIEAALKVQLRLPSA